MPALLLTAAAAAAAAPARRFLRTGALQRGRDELPVRLHAAEAVGALPTDFDAREAWPHCPSIADIWDQSACGDCWAVATVTAAADRMCVAGAGGGARLSVEHMVGCCNVCGYGCGDGFMNYAWQWLAGQKGEPYGVVTGGPYGDREWCSAYSLAPCNHYDTPGNPLPSCEGGVPPAHTPACPSACDDNSTYGVPFAQDVHRFASAYAVGSDETQIMAEIAAHGPVTTGFNVYSDWVHYRTGVYRAQGGEELGGHAVRIIGWGVEDGEKYWLVANSFGATWGNKGYFKILRGVGQCGIENSVVAGLYHANSTTTTQSH